MVSTFNFLFQFVALTMIVDHDVPLMTMDPDVTTAGPDHRVGMMTMIGAEDQLPVDRQVLKQDIE